MHGVRIAVERAGIDGLPVGTGAVGELPVHLHIALVVLDLQALCRYFVHFPDFFPAALVDELRA